MLLPVLAGSLDTFSVAEILSLVSRARGTGALRVWDGGEGGTIFCRDGDITFASVGSDRQLGDVLVRAGLLPQDDWSQASTSATPAQRVADVLGRSGIEAPRIERYIRHQTEESVFELDHWQQGEYRFDIDDDHTLGDFFRYPAPTLLAAVDQRRAEWGALLVKLGSLERFVDQAPSLPGDDDDDLRISKHELMLLRHIDGQRTVRDLARIASVGLYSTCSVVARLLDAGLVVLGDAPAQPALAPAPTAPAVASPPAEEDGASAALVEPGDGPARDLILRLLSDVKAER